MNKIEKTREVLGEIQLSLGDLLKRQGMTRASDAESHRWKADCDQTIAHLAQLGKPFSAEDVRAIVGDPLHHNAIGARFAAAAKAGVIIPAGFEEASRPSRHRAILRKWVGR